jgi:hypothetical protein
MSVIAVEKAKVSIFKRLFLYNDPKIVAYIGMLFSCLHGSLMPIFGGVMAKMLFVLLDSYNLQRVRTESDKWCSIMITLSVCAFITGFVSKFTFGVIGENVTLKVRMSLY